MTGRHLNLINYKQPVVTHFSYPVQYRLEWARYLNAMLLVKVVKFPLNFSR